MILRVLFHLFGFNAIDNAIQAEGTSKATKGHSEVDQNRLLHVRLAETETIILLDFPSLSVSNESTDEVLAIKTSNARYKDV